MKALCVMVLLLCCYLAIGEKYGFAEITIFVREKMSKVKTCGGFHELQLRCIQHPPNAVDRYRVDVAFWRIACLVVFKIRVGKSFSPCVEQIISLLNLHNFNFHLNFAIFGCDGKFNQSKKYPGTFHF